MCVCTGQDQAAKASACWNACNRAHCTTFSSPEPKRLRPLRPLSRSVLACCCCSLCQACRVLRVSGGIPSFKPHMTMQASSCCRHEPLMVEKYCQGCSHSESHAAALHWICCGLHVLLLAGACELLLAPADHCSTATTSVTILNILLFTA